MFALPQLRPQRLLIVLFSLISLVFLLNRPVRSADASFTWAPNTEPEVAVAGYRIHYGFASDQYTNQIDVGNRTDYTVASLEDGRTYYFAATAYDGEGNESDFSDEVVFNSPVPCTYTVSPPGHSFVSTGGSGTVGVATPSGCAWTAVSNAPWLVVTSNSNVTGTSAVNFSALSNTSGSARTGTLTVADHSIAVAQSGTPTYTITASLSRKGVISPAGKLAVTPGESRTFTIRAYQLFQIADVKVDGASRGPITSYTFENVNSDHTISTTFSRKEPPK